MHECLKGDNMESTVKNRKLPFLKKGLKVQVYTGEYGVITGETSGANIRVQLDGAPKSNVYHPCWKIKYFDENDNIIAEYGD
jgi:hypothetical protein